MKTLDSQTSASLEILQWLHSQYTSTNTRTHVQPMTTVAR